MIYRFVYEDFKEVKEGSFEHDGVKYPRSIFRVWTDEELNAVGVYRVIPLEVPEGMYASSWTYTLKQMEGYKVAEATPTLLPIPNYVPEEVSRAQGKAALIGAGLYESVQSYIDSLEGMKQEIAIIAFNETNTWRRDSAFLAQAALALSLSEEDLDSLFIAAELIQF